MISGASLKFFPLIFVLISGLFLTGCFFTGPQESIPVSDGVQEIKGEIFGSYYIIKYVGDLKRDSFNKELAIFFKDFNDEFSTYQKDSVITRFNGLVAQEKIVVSPRFIEMLEFSKSMHQKTSGAFDPTLGPVIKAWGFGGGGRKAIPNQDLINRALSRKGMEKLKWNNDTKEFWKTVDGVEIDVNAFAPGWACDLIGEILEKHGISNYMVDISGEILLKGEKAPNSPWIIGVEKPSAKYAQGVQIAVKMINESISTSGNYRQFFNDQGERRGHIIDPRTGRPVKHLITSATVITKTAREADALSTALMVMGKDGLKWGEKNGLPVYLIEAKKPGEFVAHFNLVMADFLKEKGLNP
jgi:FAD:protein FMN transferase